MKLRFTLLFLLGVWLSTITGGQDSDFGRTDTLKEVEMGREEYDRILKSGLVSKNDAYKRRVDRILSQLVNALPVKLYPYQAVVIADGNVNAACAPGGFMFVHEGLLVQMPDDDALASVIGHEIGHAYRRHGIREMKKMQTAITAEAISSILLGTQMNTNSLGLTRLRYSREHETEADAFGTELYLRAGFNPEKVHLGMQTLDRLFGRENRGPIYLRSHPFSEDRVKEIVKTRDALLAGGLKPINVDSPELSVEKVFGKVPTLAPIPSAYFNFNPGDFWEYEVFSGGRATSSYSISCIGAATVGLTTIYRMEVNMAGNAISYQVIPDGNRLWRRNRPQDSKSPWTLEAIVPDPAESEGSEASAFFHLASESLLTSSKTYTSTIKVLHRSGEKEFHAWYAPEVGLVQRTNTKTNTKEILVRFVSNKDSKEPSSPNYLSSFITPALDCSPCCSH